MTDSLSISHEARNTNDVRADREPLSSPPPHPPDPGRPAISAPQAGLLHRTAQQNTGEEGTGEESTVEEPELDLSSFPPPIPPPHTAIVGLGPESTHDETELDQSDRDRLAARATKPELGKLEVRQIAGLTSGVRLTMDSQTYDFSYDNETIGFQLEVDDNDRAIVMPGTTAAKLDTIPVTESTAIGSGVLDVGSARFIVRHRREHKRATDWLDQHDSIDRPEPVIHVPHNLGQPPVPSEAEGAPKRRIGRRRARKQQGTAQSSSHRTLDVVSWEFIERVRATRTEIADRERYLHPDPAELADRARHRAPILGIRPAGHPLFAKASVVVADMPWMPRFDDIEAVPDSLGEHLKPLMSLPSLPIVADLLVGPLGVVGSRSATLACARYVMLSLYAMSTTDLRLHVVTDESRYDVWDWSIDIAPEQPVDADDGFGVFVVDGVENFEAHGLNHADAIEHRIGAVFLAETIEELPSYCGTVLQVDSSGSALLTNHLGHVVAGTPIGVTTGFAAAVSADLHSVMQRRNNR